jgi:N utilization substance protein B
MKRASPARAAATARGAQGPRGARRRARELALQGLYQWLVARTPASTVRADLAESSAFAKCDSAFLDALWSGVTGEFEPLVAALTPFLDRPADRLSPIEKAVLAIGAWELMHCPDTPYRVAINEAVELAKAYGGTDGHKYVNGVLDKLAGATRAAETSAARGDLRL